MQIPTRTKIMIAVAAAVATSGAAAWAQNLRVMGTTTGEGPAFFNGTSTFNGTATFNGTTALNGTVRVPGAFHGDVSTFGTIQLVSPDSGIWGIGMHRTNEDGRGHAWKLWHMNRGYDQDALQIYEYQGDSAGRVCGGEANRSEAVPAMCDPRLVIRKGGNVGIGFTNPARKLEVNGDILAAGSVTAESTVWTMDVNLTGWLRSWGDGGWYSQTYGGGWHMTDWNWLRAYNGKSIWTQGVLASQAGLSVGYGGGGAPANGAAIAGRVAIGNTNPAQALDVAGRIRAREGTVVYQSACADGGLTVSPTTTTCCGVNEYGGYQCYGTYVPNKPLGRLVDL